MRAWKPDPFAPDAPFGAFALLDPFDPDEPENDLASTINCINTIYNHKCWNDGYHTIHHIRPGAHYTEYPLIFRENISRIARNKTLVFENIHYLHIFFYLVTRRYDKLAANIVNINNAF